MSDEKNINGNDVIELLLDINKALDPFKYDIPTALNFSTGRVLLSYSLSSIQCGYDNVEDLHAMLIEKYSDELSAYRKMLSKALADSDLLTDDTDDWVIFDGDYEKTQYDVKLPDGTIITGCWPNAGHMCSMDGSGRNWSETDNIQVKESEARHG